MPDFKQILRERLHNSGISPLRESEIADEIAQHLRDRYHALLSGGASEEQALTEIMAHLDQRDLAAEVRAVEQSYSEPVPLGATGKGSFWATLLQDVRYGLRVLRLNPGFTTVCLLSLALGIGANTAIFELIDAVRMRTVPVPDPQELAVIRPTDNGRTGHVTGRYHFVTNPIWEQIRANHPGFRGVFAWGATGFNLANGGEARNAQGLWVSGEFFDVLGIEAVLGRVFHPADDHPGCGTPGAVISYSFWQREFGGDANVTSKTVSIEGHPFPILGVTPASFYGLDVGRSFDVAVPICSEPVINADGSYYNVRHAWWLAVMGRLEPGWSLEKTGAALATISPGIMQETLPPAFSPDIAKRFLAMKLAAYPGATGLSTLRNNYETPLWLLLAIAGLVLLIACANLANLMLARAGAREREIAVRLALGAARQRLIRQLLTESLLLAFGGALLGTILARGLSRLLINYLSGENPQAIFIPLATDWRVLGFTIGLAILTCMLFGLMPALKATSAAPARVMSLAGRGIASTRERFSLRRALVVTQVALSLVLVVTAIAFGGSLRKILTLDAGFQRDGLLVMDFDFSHLHLPPAQRMAYAESLLDRLRALPGIESAAETTVVPVGGSYWNDRVIVDGKPSDIYINMSRISGGYFKTMGTPLLAGRDFDARDNINAPRVAIVTEQFAHKFFGNDNPVGKTFKIDVYKGETPRDYQIVGLVKDTRYKDLREDFGPIAFYPQLQDEKPDPGNEVLVRSSLALEPLLVSLRRAVADTNPELVVDFHPYNGLMKLVLLRERLLATLSGFFGGLAIVLATVGLYGVIAYLVVRRTNEIGIRMALGATPSRILGMVLREAANLLIFGVIIGAVLAIASGRIASTLLFGLKPYDPAVLIAASLTLCMVAVGASLLPARRAARLQPTVALREE